MPLTKEGYRKRSPEEIKEDIENTIQGEGSSFLRLPADVQNNLIDTAVPVIMQFENIAAEILNSYGLDYANDSIWLNIAKSVGLVRKGPVKSQVELKFTGVSGTFIPQGTRVGAFETSKAVTLDSSGVAFVLATSEDYASAPAETLTKIDAQLGADLKVINPEAAIAAQPEETMAQLRERTKIMFKSAHKGGLEYATAQLKGLPGVDPRLVKFRWVDYSYTTIEKGLTLLKKVTGIEAVVGGGDAHQIAGTLFASFLETSKFLSLPSNKESQRTVNTFVRYHDIDREIVFTRPKNLDLGFKIDLSFFDKAISSSAAEGIIKEAFTNFINTYPLGDRLNKAALESLIYTKFKEYGIGSNNLVNIKFEILNKEGEAQEFDENGFLKNVKHDCYLTLRNLTVETTLSKSKEEEFDIPSPPEYTIAMIKIQPFEFTLPDGIQTADIKGSSFSLDYVGEEGSLNMKLQSTRSGKPVIISTKVTYQLVDKRTEYDIDVARKYSISSPTQGSVFTYIYGSSLEFTDYDYQESPRRLSAKLLDFMFSETYQEGGELSEEPNTSKVVLKKEFKIELLLGDAYAKPNDQ